LMDKRIGGAVKEVCSYYFKSPPEKFESISAAKQMLEKFLNNLL